MIAQSMLPEFDHEMQVTRALLERVPLDRPEWTPHRKSMPLGQLAAHVVDLVAWMTPILTETSLHFNPPGGPPTPRPEVPATAAELVARFDAARDASRALLAGASDEQLMVPWTFQASGHTVFTMPRVAVLRGFVMNHVIHHRAQLSVYLRLNDVPLPPMYGPTADS
jgi:uncharacterized damage-inducible protein DinB